MAITDALHLCTHKRFYIMIKMLLCCHALLSHHDLHVARYGRQWPRLTPSALLLKCTALCKSANVGCSFCV